MRKLITSLCMLMLCCALTYAQTRTVTGKVTDAQGKPVPYATVTVKGTKIITQTDEQGNFTIKAGSGNVLNVTYQGQQEEVELETHDRQYGSESLEKLSAEDNTKCVPRPDHSKN